MRNFVMLQRFGHHHRAQVRAAYANVDDIFDGFTRVAFPRPTDQLLTKLLHALQHFPHFGHYVLTAFFYWLIRHIPQRHMQYSAAFGLVDRLSAKHSLYSFLQLALFGQLQQGIQGLLRNAVFGVV